MQPLEGAAAGPGRRRIRRAARGLQQLEAALPAEKRDKVLVVTHGIPALMTAYLEVFVEAGPVLYSRQTKAGDPNGMFFAGSGYMKRPGAGYPDAEMIKGFAKKL